MKFYGGLVSGPRTSHSNFWGNPVYDPEFMNLYHMHTESVVFPRCQHHSRQIQALISVIILVHIVACWQVQCCTTIRTRGPPCDCLIRGSIRSTTGLSPSLRRNFSTLVMKAKRLMPRGCCWHLEHMVVLLWFDTNFPTQQHQITSLETRDSRLPYGENPDLYLTWAWFGTRSWHPRPRNFVKEK